MVDGSGREIASVGDTALAFPLRSTSKPFQLLPYLLEDLHRTHPRGGDELEADLAVMMSSHAGEPMHTTRVAGILDAFGLDVAALRCGAHWPYHTEARDALLRAGGSPGALHSNCSGKHTGMLAVCAHLHWPIEGYTENDHPLQRRIHEIIRGLSGEQTNPLPVSVDGCSLPTFWVSLRGLARMYALLAYPRAAPPVENRNIRDLLELLYAAGTHCPEMIGGTERFDTRLMRAFSGRLFAKSGAAGVYAMAVAPCDAYPSGLGIGFKVEDGDFDNRVRPVVACEILRQLDIQPPDAGIMASLANATIRNVRNLEVGMYRATFRLG